MFPLKTRPPDVDPLPQPSPFFVPLCGPVITPSPRQVSTSFMEDPLGSETKVGLKLGFKTREVWLNMDQINVLNYLKVGYNTYLVNEYFLK